MAMTTMRRPVPLEQQPSRAAQRRQRLLELEHEQRLEDLEALKMTEEQRLILFHSFRSVKFEWSDLDGMRHVRRRYNSPVQTWSSAPRAQTSPPHTFAQTAHPQAAVPRPPPLDLHSPQYERPHLPLPASSLGDAVPFPHTPVSFPSSETDPEPSSPTPTVTPRDVAWGASLAGSAPTSSPAAPSQAQVRTRATTAPVARKPRVRASVKSLCAPAGPAHATLPLPLPIIVPRLYGGEEDDDDDAWVDEEDDGESDTTMRADDGDGHGDEGFDEDTSALPTPVVPRAWRFEGSLPLNPLGGGDGGYAHGHGHDSVRTPMSAGVVYSRTPTPSTADPDAQTHVGAKRKR